MTVHRLKHDGYLIEGDCMQAIPTILSLVDGPCAIVTDPPYGNIVDRQWDQVDHDYYKQLTDWAFLYCDTLLLPGGAMWVWGGIGKPRETRHFFKFIMEVEERHPRLAMATLNTWGKKRAYGIDWAPLFCREELAYFVNGDPRKPRVFNIPLLDKLRGYAGYDPEHPAKSEFLRLTNVWSHVTEIFRGKRHVNEKPLEVFRIPIRCSTNEGEWVVDPFAGSGTAGEAAREMGRRFILVERDPEAVQTILKRLA